MSYKLSNEDRQWVEASYERLKTKMHAECLRVGDKIPYIPRDGRYHDLDSPEQIFWWTNGFWAGLLWQMYNATGEECYRKAAEGVEIRLDEALMGFMGLHHDVGFMWLHTAVANYRLTKNAGSRVRGLHAANILAGRYNPAGKFIVAWNENRAGWMIVDCMMNLPILYWAEKELSDARFGFIAKNHADTCMKITVRGDGSCNHISILDPNTGECLENPGGQGYAPGSSWSRGHAWAIYGFVLSYHHTENPEYLDTAKKIAHYFIANMAKNDWLPLVDFRSPKEPVKYDSTAAMIASCGLLEIAKHVGEYEQSLYVETALKMLRACDDAFCNWDPEIDSIVARGMGAYHSTGFDEDAPIIYGDYFLTEAILRLLGKDFLIW